MGGVPAPLNPARGRAGIQEGLGLGEGAITSFRSAGGHSALTPPQGHKEGQANPIWKALFAEEEKKKVISSQETDTLIYIGCGSELAEEEVFSNEEWTLWPSKWPRAVSHS